ncbi:IncP-type DNA transfer coupling protein TraG (plasmid) [Acidisarcina polymorpha]|uniref:IncP-type DNA transfer coupling protein TraG n=1 Tax=Acidisarcina polymorpha TaxID=2211140 RepID=A0A2Z5GAZ9_9BACT|nr:type IV secretory system conjugative DNA transfer family protein [Acidisarcina polymorpha]AXC16422.1 IncP-type DNA transfer coupling protein TraG [Acidisarcina polymorpha]
MSKTRQAPPGYVLPSRPRWQGGINLSSLFGALLAFATVAWAATEWLAFTLGNPLEMGQPLGWHQGIGIFPPYAGLVLWKKYAGSRFIGSVVRREIWEAFGITFVGGIFAAYLGYWVLSLLRDRRSTDSLQNIHGSAAWATQDDIKKLGLFDAQDGVYIGGWRNPKTNQVHYLIHSGAEPVLLFAPSRSGKGVSAIIPTLCQWRQSVFVYDLKGENWDKTSGFRAAIGQRVLKFAPTLPAESCCYNPLSEIRWETDYEISDVQTIANAVVRHGNDETMYKHFEDAAVDLVSAGIVHLGYLYRNLETPREVTLPDVLALYSSPGEDFKSVLTTMQNTIHMPGGKTNPRLRWLDLNGRLTYTHPFVGKAVQRQLNRADREASSIQSSVVTPMTIYDDPIVMKTVSHSDFQIRDLVYGEKPMSLYFKVPQPDRDRLRPLVRLMLQLIFNRLMEQLDSNRKHLLLMLDEFPELKKIPNLASAMSLMAGYKIKPYLIAQTLTQIVEEYGPNESITDNCYIKAAFQTDNLQTCKNLSELSGNMTVEKETVNYSGARTDFYLKHIFRSVEQVSRPLITVDEIRRIKPPQKASNDPNSKITAPGDMLIFINGVAPIYGVQSLYFLNDTLLARTQLSPPVFQTAEDRSRPFKPVESPGVNIKSIVAAATAALPIQQEAT